MNLRSRAGSEQVVVAAPGVLSGRFLLLGEQAGVEERTEAGGVEIGAREDQVLDAVAALGVPVQSGGQTVGRGDQVPGGLGQRGQPGARVLDRDDAGDGVPGQQRVWVVGQPEAGARAYRHGHQLVHGLEQAGRVQRSAAAPHGGDDVVGLAVAGQLGGGGVHAFGQFAGAYPGTGDRGQGLDGVDRGEGGEVGEYRADSSRSSSSPPCSTRAVGYSSCRASTSAR
jgi:hypothetical protein